MLLKERESLKFENNLTKGWTIIKFYIYKLIYRKKYNINNNNNFIILQLKIIILIYTVVYQ